MTRIERRFAELKREGRAGLVTFITAGDPDYETSLAILKALPGAGADVIELGMPFSDPMADGPAIQASSQRALKSGQTMKKTLQMVKAFRAADATTPIVLMGYYNPIYVYPVDRFIADAVAGRSRRSDRGRHAARGRRRASPRRHRGRVELHPPRHADDGRQRGCPAVLANTSGFLYYVSIAGITGTAAPDIGAVGAHVGRIKAHTDLPIAVGFGVKTEDQVSALARIAEGVVVGSALVGAVAESLDAQGKATRKTKPQVLGLVERLAAALRQKAEAVAL